MTSPADLFALVDRHVTGPMAAAGYAKIGEYDEVTDAARGVPLTRLQGRAAPSRVGGLLLGLLLPHRVKRPAEHVLRVGYEGFDENGEDDEKWLAYFPETGDLDLQPWAGELAGHADWDVRNDRVLPTDEEIERRLRVVGAAMHDRAND